jgi:hypothetical protein
LRSGDVGLFFRTQLLGKKAVDVARAVENVEDVDCVMVLDVEDDVFLESRKWKISQAFDWQIDKLIGCADAGHCGEPIESSIRVAQETNGSLGTTVAPEIVRSQR